MNKRAVAAPNTARTSNIAMDHLTRRDRRSSRGRFVIGPPAAVLDTAGLLPQICDWSTHLSECVDCI
jgi:hypothetical protein